MLYKIDNRPDMGTFATKRDAMYWRGWLLRVTGVAHKVVPA